MNVLINWSGGKDSTTSVYLHLAKNDVCYVRCFIPLFTENIPMITKKHYEFILRQASLFRQRGAIVEFVYPSLTFYDYCVLFGYPYFGNCGYRSFKISALSKPVDFDVDVVDIGIAFDEKKRFKSLNDNKISILVDSHFTENDCLAFCYINDCLSPHYLISKRDGCSLCPNASDIQRYIWLCDYPEAIPLLRKLDIVVKSKFSERYKVFPLRGYKSYLDFLDARHTASPIFPCSEHTEQA